MSHTSVFAAPFARSADRDFVVRCVLGLAPSGGADIGEVLAAVGEVKPKDAAAWRSAWQTLGERVARQAADAAAGGRSDTARWASLRAANYLAVAVDAASAADDTDRAGALFAAHRAAWDAFAAGAGVRVSRIDVPLDGTLMPGYLFHADAAGPRPTIAFVNGSDGSISSLWGTGVAAALARGFHAYVFDGPGQQSMLFQHHVPFRADWENVLTPVLDELVSHRYVDEHRVVVWGISQAGYWVPRALSGEHRFAAAVVDPGVVDVSTSWTDHLPASLGRLLDEGKDAQFDRDMALGMRFSPDLSATWAFRSRPVGVSGYAAVIRRIREFALTDAQSARIDTPLLITSPEGEQFWPGQSERLAAMTPDVSHLVRFTAAEGADGHCEPLARTLVHERVLDWVSATIQV
ncbi:alpha/beta fold hydrolase [Microbacterium neimengense]